MIPNEPTGIRSGMLRVIARAANPARSDQAQLLLFAGDATAEPIRALVPDPGVVLPGQCERLRTRSMQLVVLHFGDLHNRLLGAGPDPRQAAVARLAGGVRAIQTRHAERSDAAVVVVGGGDDIGGSAFDAMLSRRPDEPPCHPAYRLLSAMGVDAAVVGNHDLDFGLDMLAHWTREARFPLLSANLVCTSNRTPPSSPSPLIPVFPAALLVVKGLRIGLIGLTTPSEVRSRGAIGFEVTSPLPAAAHLVAALRPLCDVLIILSHLGYSIEDPSGAVVVAGDVELARSLPFGAVHLIVGAHTHRALNSSGLDAENIVQRTAIVQAGAHGHYLGEVRLAVQAGQGQEAVVAVTHAQLTRVADLPVDEGFEQQHIQPLVEQVLWLREEKLGIVSSHPDLNEEQPSLTLGSGESALANFLADALVARCRAVGIPIDIAAVDASILPHGLPAGGNLTLGDWYDALPINDTIVVYWLTSGELLDLLKDNAQRTERPDEPCTERGFMQFSAGLRYVAALGRYRIEARALEVRLHDERFDPPCGHHVRRPILMATSSLVRQAAARWARVVSEEIRSGLYHLDVLPSVDTGLRVRDELAAFAKEHGGITESSGLRRDGRLRLEHEGELVVAAPRYLQAARRPS